MILALCEFLYVYVKPLLDFVMGMNLMRDEFHRRIGRRIPDPGVSSATLRLLSTLTLFLYLTVLLPGRDNGIN